jgi:hypothetical protein
LFATAAMGAENYFGCKADKLSWMKAYSGRSAMATTLSLWLGVLACLLGCAGPTTASTERHHLAEASAAKCPDGDNEVGDSCCQHGHNPGGSEKNRHHAISCCPTETALIQKQNSTPPALTHFFAAVLALANYRTSGFVFARASTGPSDLWQSGRNILLQVHTLRI